MSGHGAEPQIYHRSQLDYAVILCRLKRRFDNAHNGAHLLMRYKLLFFAVYRRAEIAVVIVGIRMGAFELILLDSSAAAGRKRFCKSCRDLYGQNVVVIAPVGAAHNMNIIAPVVIYCGTRAASHIHERHVDEVICADLNVQKFSALEEYIDKASVVNGDTGEIVKMSVYSFNVVAQHIKLLVYHVNAPVIKHSAAVLNGLSPVAGNAVVAVYAGLKGASRFLRHTYGVVRLAESFVKVVSYIR